MPCTNDMIQAISPSSYQRFTIIIRSKLTILPHHSGSQCFIKLDGRPRFLESSVTAKSWTLNPWQGRRLIDDSFATLTAIIISTLSANIRSQRVRIANHAPHHHHDSAMSRTCGEYRMSGSLCVERNERDTAILFVMHSGGYLSWGRLTSASKPHAQAPVPYSAWSRSIGIYT